jgi:hypothetical protein
LHLAVDDRQDFGVRVLALAFPGKSSVKLAVEKLLFVQKQGPKTRTMTILAGQIGQQSCKGASSLPPISTCFMMISSMISFAASGHAAREHVRRLHDDSFQNFPEISALHGGHRRYFPPPCSEIVNTYRRQQLEFAKCDPQGSGVKALSTPSSVSPKKRARALIRYQMKMATTKGMTIYAAI